MSNEHTNPSVGGVAQQIFCMSGGIRPELHQSKRDGLLRLVRCRYIFTKRSHLKVNARGSQSPRIAMMTLIFVEKAIFAAMGAEIGAVVLGKSIQSSVAFELRFASFLAIKICLLD